MKLFKIMTFIACLNLFLTACNDFLDTRSESKFTDVSVFSNIVTADQVLTGIYDVVRSGYMWDYNLMWFLCDTDVECSFQNYDGARNDVCHYRANEGTDLLERSWEEFYKGIERMNLITDFMPNGSLWNDPETAQEARRIYGEAVTMRAYIYYYVAGLWGDVPFPISCYQPGDNLYLAKTDRDVIYETLIEQLKEVEEYLPWAADAGTVKRATRGFNKGMQARLALMYAGHSLRGRSENYVTRTGPKQDQYYQIADNALREIIESGKHGLVSDFEQFFKDLHAYRMNVTEMMFEPAYGRSYSGRVAQTLGMPFSTNPPEPKYGRAAAEFSLTPHYWFTFDRTDKRRDVSSELYNYANATYLSTQQLIDYRGLGFKPTKYRRCWIEPNFGGGSMTTQATGVAMPLMRYTDILLLYAETQNEINNGPTAAAKSALTSVRRRAFPEELWAVKVNNYVDSVSVNKEKFFNALVNERAWEFSGEFLRKFDLIRWNLLADKKDEMRAMVDQIVNHPDEPPFDWAPKEIFWRTSPEDGETIDIVNRDFRYIGPVPYGYNARNWIANLTDVDKVDLYESFDRVMNGYRRNMNNHILPIPRNVLDSSKGAVENDVWRPYNTFD